MTNTHIPATRNEGWGFWGTMGGHACIAWPLAMTAVADATGKDLDIVRGFLEWSVQPKGQSLPLSNIFRGISSCF